MTDTSMPSEQENVGSLSYLDLHRILSDLKVIYDSTMFILEEGPKRNTYPAILSAAHTANSKTIDIADAFERLRETLDS